MDKHRIAEKIPIDRLIMIFDEKRECIDILVDFQTKLTNEKERE